MTRGGETSNVLGQLVSGNYFDLLELRPFLGRGFLPEEDTTPNGHPVAVLSYKFWKKLGGDRNIIGDTITLNGRAFTVIGVAPPGFTGIDIGRGAGDLDAVGDARLGPAFRRRMV